MGSNRTCLAEGCERKPHARGLCDMHYQQAQWQGTLNAFGAQRMPVAGLTCTEDGCEAPRLARGLCRRHYRAVLRSEKECSVEGCTDGVLARGLCSMHYQRFVKTGSTDDPFPETCTLEGCDLPYFALGFCKKHHSRWKRQGHTDPTRGVDAFWLRVNENGPIPAYRPDLGPCWVWDGPAESWNGYSGVMYQGRKEYGHRVSYLIHVGSIPAGMEIDHLCRVRICVNPKHLEAVTSGENNRRARVAKQLGFH